jgi:hypothetical protein
MKAKYTANAYCNEEKIATREGDEIEKLYAWLVLQADGNFGDVHGEILDNKTLEVVKRFQKTYLD